MELTEFDKQKIAFAVALLATLFTLTPAFISDNSVIGNYGFNIGSTKFTITGLYYFVSATLGLAVYFYAIQLITPRGVRFVASIGNTLYAIALVLPVLYFVILILISILKSLPALASDLGALTVTSLLLSLIPSGIAAFATRLIQRKLTQKDRDAISEQLSRQEFGYLRRASELYKNNQFDLSVIDAFKAVEIAATHALLKKGKRIIHNQWSAALIGSEMLPESLSEDLNNFRKIRNLATHGETGVTSEEAGRCLKTAERIIAGLTDKPDE